MTGPVWIVGVDPGGRHTGITVIDRAGWYCGHTLVDREDGNSRTAWARRVCCEVRDWMPLDLDCDPDAVPIVAIEDVTAPNPHIRRRDGNAVIDPAGVIDTAWVAGAVTADLSHITRVQVVAPAGHGAPVGDRRVLQQLYPSELVGDRETKGTGRLRHCRSAYDVAQAARRTVTR